MEIKVCAFGIKTAILLAQKDFLRCCMVYNNLPAFLRPAFLSYVKRNAAALDRLVCKLFPPAAGAPYPSEEMFLTGKLLEQETTKEATK